MRKNPETLTAIQVDNAPGHSGYNTNNVMNDLCQDEGLETLYTTQPPQIPDFNINDLSIFDSLQKKTHKLRRDSNQNILDLWGNVATIFEQYSMDTITIGFGHLLACCN